MVQENREVTKELSRYIVHSRYEDIPYEVIHEAKRSFLNWVGCAIGGCQHEAVSTALRVLKKLTAEGDVTIIGGGGKLDVMQATLINSMSSLVLDYDDAHSGKRIILHPSGPVASAAYSISESRGGDGKKFIEALILGIEVMCRVGNSVYESDSVGWYQTSTVGTLGAAVTSGKLLGLDEKKMAWALGIAVSQSAGMRISHGTMTKSFSPARAASSGVLAALLAEEGFTSAENSIEAAGTGFADLMGNRGGIETVVDGLGSQFEILHNTYKPFACAIGIHPSINACLNFLEEPDFDASKIAKIELKVFPRVAKANSIRHPRNGLEAKISLPHAIAVALLHGCAGEKQFSDEEAVNEKLFPLRECVSFSPDPKVKVSEAFVTITDGSGKTYSQHIENVIGSIERPMSDAELEEKVIGLSQDLIGEKKARNLIEFCWNLDDEKNFEYISELVKRI